MKPALSEKIVIGACVLGISAVTFRAIRLLAIGLACCGTNVYKYASRNRPKKRLPKTGSPKGP